MNTTSPICPKCGAPLPANSPAGLCARCLMAMNLATQTVLPDEPGGSPPEAKPPPPAPEDIATHFPGFDILGCLGRGGMGVVYKARQKSLNRLVALKILAPERERDAAFAQRFAVEAGTLARLNHPGIVTIYDFGQADGLFYFVMEFVDGVSLRQLLSNGRVAPREALAIVPEICDALQYAHDQGIVHRDIKPENVLLDRRGRVKVADFGLAKLVGTASDRAGSPLPAVASQIDDGAHGVPRPTDSLTDAGKIMGTPQYMAPEQAEKPAEVDHRADIYALGVVFYQMLTGELPGKPLEPPSRKVQIDVRLDEVVMRALEQDPGRRYSQASVLKTQLETIAGTPPARSPVSRSERPRFSRTAIVGACWPLFSVLASIYYYRSHSGSLIGGLMVPWWLMFINLLGFTAPFGMTILGWIAVSQIRRSAGQLYGMGLAVLDGLLFPLLTLNIVTGCVGACGLVYAALALLGNGLGGTRPSLISGAAVLSAAVLTLLVLIPSDIFLVRWVWRAVNQPVDGANASAPAAACRANRKSLLFIVGLVMLALLGTPAFIKYRSEHASVESLVESFWKLPAVPTARVIQVAMTKPDLPWAWQELERRAQTGRLNASEAGLILDGLTARLRQDSSNSYDQSLAWISPLLDELRKRGLVQEEAVLGFLEALYGNPSCEPLRRLRETAHTLNLTCRSRDVWPQDLLGFVLLNEMHSITIDGQSVALDTRLPRGRSWPVGLLSEQVELPTLTPGKHTVKCEIVSILVAAKDMAGLAPDAPSRDWPPAKKRWTRTCQAELSVYAKDAQIVSLTQDPALDPVTSGGLSVKQVVVRRQGDQATATVLLDVNSKLPLPISFDVTLRVGGQTARCGSVWSHAPTAGRHFSPIGTRLEAGIRPLDPQVTEAEIILTPNPSRFEDDPTVERIWGKEVKFSHVPLTRYDLR